MQNITNYKYPCLLCQKGFITSLQLKIHQKFKHTIPTSENYQNINSSDISDSQEENIKRNRELYRKQAESSNNQSSKLSDNDEAEMQQGQEKDKDKQKQIKNSLPGKFDDPSLQKNGLKKIYLCGCSQKVFENSQCLTLHISKQHNGFPPQGTLYGVCRDLVIKQFKPVQQKMPIIRPFIEKTQFVCGCNLSYVNLSSLKHHIKTNHEGIAPIGTIGLPKITQNNNLHNLKEQYDQKQNTETRQQSLTCKACFQNLPFNYWICDSCEQWRICGICIDSQQKISQHQNLNHKVHPIQLEESIQF